jgi:hypothetical protein
MTAERAGPTGAGPEEEELGLVERAVMPESGKKGNVQV